MTYRRTFLHQTSAAILASQTLPALGNSTPEKIKIAQIGTEHAHASGKLSTILNVPNIFELAGVAAESKSHQREALKDRTYHNVKWLTEDEVLSDPSIQAITVETNVDQLVPTALRCVQAGKHIHLDKPAGENNEDFQTVVSIAKEKKLQIQMGYMYRYNPAFQFCYQAIKQGWLGDVFSIHAVMSKKSGDNARQTIAQYSGGTMFELGCHLIDSIVYLLGKPTKVTAFHKQTYPKKDSLRDNQIAILEYPSAIATVRASLIEPFGFDQRQFVVNGTEGTIEIQPIEPPQLKIASNVNPKYRNGFHQVELPKSKGRYHEQLIDFADTIQGKTQSAFSYQHDLDTHAAILQASI